MSIHTPVYRSLTVIILFLELLFQREGTSMSMLKISSPAFQHKGHIPSTYTCDGADINPPLLLENIPAGAKSLAMIVDDPDAPRGTWVHWVVWNIGPDTREIKEHSVPAGATEGINDFRKHRYGGPCPPSGTHRYFFKLYALDETLKLVPGTDKAGLEKAMQGRILGQAELIGLYARK